MREDLLVSESQSMARRVQGSKNGHVPPPAEERDRQPESEVVRPPRLDILDPLAQAPVAPEPVILEQVVAVDQARVEEAEDGPEDRDPREGVGDDEVVGQDERPIALRRPLSTQLIAHRISG